MLTSLLPKSAFERLAEPFPSAVYTCSLFQESPSWCYPSAHFWSTN